MNVVEVWLIFIFALAGGPWLLVIAFKLYLEWDVKPDDKDKKEK